MDDTDSNWMPPPPPPPPPGQPPVAPRSGRLRGKTAAMATAVGLVGGGIVGGYAITQAASPSPSSSASAATTSPSPTPGYGDHRGPGGPGGANLGGPNDRAEDEQTVADAIGISVSQLETAEQGGQTIAAIAKAHNVDVNKVISALVTAKGKEIDAALTAGTITSAQATQMKSDAQQQATDQVNGSGPGGHGGPGGPGGLQSEDLTVVAGALGISSSQLQTDLQNGQTIAAVAKARSVDVNTVISAWVASENQEIDARVSSGQLTPAQATQEKQQTQQRVTDEVNGTGHPGPGGPWGGPRGAGPNPSA